jgi:hypothetical protein
MSIMTKAFLASLKNKSEADMDAYRNSVSEGRTQGLLANQIEADKKGAERAKKNQADLDARIAKYGNKINQPLVTKAPSTSVPLEAMVGL